MEHNVDVDEEAANEIMKSTAPGTLEGGHFLGPLIDLPSSGDGHRFFCRLMAKKPSQDQGPTLGTVQQIKASVSAIKALTAAVI
jgi:hypothetical protein